MYNMKLVVSKGRYEWAVGNIEEKTYSLGKIHYNFIFYSLSLVLALHMYDCHLIKQSQKSYALKNFHLLRLRNNYSNHKNLKCSELCIFGANKLLGSRCMYSKERES